MKKALLLIGLIFFFSAGKIWSDDKIKIAIIDFEDRTTDSVDAASIMELFQTEMVNVGGFIVVERSQLKSIMEEQKMSMSGLTEEDAVKLGELTGAGKVLLGFITKFDKYYVINVKAIDTSSGVIEFADKVMAEEQNQFMEVLTILAERIKKRSKGEDVMPFTPNDIPGRSHTTTHTTTVEPTDTDDDDSSTYSDDDDETGYTSDDEDFDSDDQPEEITGRRTTTGSDTVITTTGTETGNGYQTLKRLGQYAFFNFGFYGGAFAVNSGATQPMGGVSMDFTGSIWGEWQWSFGLNASPLEIPSSTYGTITGTWSDFYLDLMLPFVDFPGFCWNLGLGLGYGAMQLTSGSTTLKGAEPGIDMRSEMYISLGDNWVLKAEARGFIPIVTSLDFKDASDYVVASYEPYMVFSFGGKIGFYW